jgi:2-keto-3-deoxy-L-rhamnonate aldolase RhmA
MRNPLKDKLKKGEVAIGTFVGLGHPDVTERLSMMGFDWLLLDAEHGPLGLETMQMMMQAMRGDTCVPIIRVEWNEPVIIKRALDLGAGGVLIPWVNTKEEAIAAVQACKYPPNGIRGCGPRRAALVHDNYISTANDNILVAVQIETVTAVKNIDEILAVDGVDVVYIGPTDLCMSMYGVPAKWGDPQYMAAFDTVVAAAKKAGKPAGIYATSGNIKWAIEKGFTFPSVDSADGFLAAGAAAALQKAKDACAIRK